MLTEYFPYLVTGWSLMGGHLRSVAWASHILQWRDCILSPSDRKPDQLNMVRPDDSVNL